MRRIYLIDCPGVVYPTGDSDTDIVLKGVVSDHVICIPKLQYQGVHSLYRDVRLKVTYQKLS